MAEKKNARASRKSVLTRWINDITSYLADEDKAGVKQRLDTIKEKFENFQKAHDEYHATLTAADDIEASDDYYCNAQTSYVSVIKSAKAWLKEFDAKAKQDEEIDAENSLKEETAHTQKELIHYLNLPKVELPSYDGDPLKFHNFITLFDENVDAVCDDDRVKLTRLLQYTCKQANDAIQSCVVLGGTAGYKKAREILSSRFGDSHLISQKVISTLRSTPVIRSADQLVRFSDDLQNCYTTLSSLKEVKEVDTQTFIIDLLAKLQPYIRNKWRKKAIDMKEEEKRYPSFKEFVAFVSREATIAADPVYGEKCHHTSSNPKSTFVTSNTNGNEKSYKCILCHEKHRLMYCSKFKEMRVSERVRLVASNKLCENCLMDNHTTNNCRKESVCSVPGCGKRHTRFIHVNDSRTSDRTSAGDTDQNVRLVNANVNASLGVHMPVVAVKVNDSLDVCALLDTASSNTFCSKTLTESLNVKGVPVKYSMRTLSGDENVVSDSVELTLSSLDGQEILHLNNVYVMDRIPVKTSCPDFKHYPKFKGLQFVAGGQTVDLLIGQDNAEALCPIDVIRGEKGEPFACKTLFGWSINGPDRIHGPVSRKVVSHFIKSAPVADVDRLWNVENDGLNAQDISVLHNDRRVLQFQDQSTELVNGHAELVSPEQVRDVGNRISAPDNPADVVTIGQSVESPNSERWFHGSKFLHQYKCDWRVGEVNIELSDNDPEIKHEIISNVVATQDDTPTDRLLAYFSDWFKLKRAVGWLLKFTDFLRKRKQGYKVSRLSTLDFSQAEMAVIGYVQRKHFSSELSCLAKGQSVPKNSSIKTLSPVLDENGLVRVKGRLGNAPISVDHKRPYIVPHASAIARLIVRDVHNHAHLGTEWVVSLIRQRFWITKVRVMVKSVSRQCVRCKRMFASPGDQLMADLPLQRVEPGKPPFASVGLDCFGPFHVKHGRSQVKRYGCIFTCMASRAIHLEGLSCMSTDSFINCLKRFMTRRGQPELIFCDNGSNFIGAKTELERDLKSVDFSKIDQYCVVSGIEWKFNPPCAPHMGGVWERLVGVVKKVLTGLLDLNTSSRMSDEMFQTLLCEVEGIVNGRPLTKVSEDVHDCEALTPNHLLMLRKHVIKLPGNFCQADIYRKRWRAVQYLADQFWSRWTREYIPELQRRCKWLKLQRNLKTGDLVLICDENTPRNVWPLGLVTEVFHSSDGLVRSAKVKTKCTMLIRPVTKLVLLECSE